MNAENEPVSRWQQRRSKPPVGLYLRTRHCAYLDYISQRDEIPLSRAVANIIAETSELTVTSSDPSHKEYRKVVMDPAHLDKLNCLVVTLGIDRSEIMRRLIDRAMSEDPILRLA